MPQPNNRISFEDRLRQEFGEASIPPPADAWEKIHDALLRDEVKESTVLPPPAVWDRIQDALPVSTPWYVKYRWGLVAALLLFSMVGTYNFYQYEINPTSGKNFNAESGTVDQSQKVSVKADDKSKSNITKLDLASAKQGNIEINSPAQKQILTSNSSTSKVAEESNKSEKLGKKKSSSKASNLSSNDNSGTELAKNKSKKKDKSLQRASGQGSKNSPSNIARKTQDNSETTELNSTEINGNAEGNSSDMTYDANYVPQPIDLKQVVFNDDEELVLKKGKKTPKSKYGKLNSSKGFYVSPMAGIQYNTMSKTAFDKDADFSTLERKPSYGATIGLGLGYDINDRFAVMAEWIYSSSENQKYTTVKEGKEADIKVALDYMKFPLIFKYKHRLIGNNRAPMLLSFNAGLHYSLLRSRNTFVNGELEYFDQKHNQRQWGALAGVEVDVFTSKQLYFTFGSRFSYSASTEVFGKKDPLGTPDPLSFQTTIYTRLNFKFVRKNTSNSTTKVLSAFE